MGGEPLCEENAFLTSLVLINVKKHFPNVKTYLWTGYYYEDLVKSTDSRIKTVLRLTDVLIDGPYIEAKRDVTLPMRGSSNQSIINLKEMRNEQRN
jgi:anaerobic ribonucleoside-triphosphate reductase activating protein